VIHFYAAMAAIPAAAALILHAGAGSMLSAVVYSAVMIGLFSTSAYYHKPMWAPERRMILRRVDRSMIYVFIAGSYTPLCLALGGSASALMLPCIWGVAMLGVVKSMIWSKLPRVITAIPYVFLGWSAMPYAQEFLAKMGAYPSVLLGLGGLFYTIGALAYARKWPDPKPETFGYHEVFHALVVAAVVCHYSAVWDLVA